MTSLFRATMEKTAAAVDQTAAAAKDAATVMAETPGTVATVVGNVAEAVGDGVSGSLTVTKEVVGAAAESITAVAEKPTYASSQIADVIRRRLPDPDRRVEVAFKFTVGVSVLVCLAVIRRTFRDAEATRYDLTDPDAKRIARQQSRGTVASVLTSLSFGLVNFAVDYYGDVNAATSTALIGMVFGGTVGFLMDNAMGSDAGWKLWSTAGRTKAWKYALGCLSTDRYIRYAITVLFDMFLTLILFRPIYTNVKNLPYFNKGNAAMANGLCSTIIGLITFQAYANVTRFTWAYPSTDSQEGSDWIKGATMQVLVSIAATLFLASNTKVEGEQFGINDEEVKLPLVLGSMVLLWVLSTRNAMQPKLDVAVVPDNIFVVVSDTALEVGATVAGGTLTDVSKGEPVDDDSFEVIRDFGENKYLIRRLVPAHKYDIASNLNDEEISAKSMKGSLILLGLGLATSYPTIYITGANKDKRSRIFFSFMAMTTALAAPGMMA